MDYSTQGITQSASGGSAPDFALVFHRQNHKEACAVTMHKVINDEIQIGDYIDTLRLKSVIKDSTNEKDNDQVIHLILQQVVLGNTDHLVWHTRASRRILHIRGYGGGIHAKVYYPAPLLIATKTTSRIRTFALASSSRPTMKTILYNAPFHNLDGAGALCLGSSPSPALLIQARFHKSNLLFSMQMELTRITVRL